MKQLLRAALARWYRLPWVRRRWERRFAAAAVAGGDVPWSPLTRPLAQCRLALVTTGGVHLATDPPFDMSDARGDASWRRIPWDALPAALAITHDYYDHSDADRDVDLVLPVGALRRAIARGRVGSAAPTHVSLMGHIQPPHVDTLVNQSAPEIARMLGEDAVDVCVLVPG